MKVSVVISAFNEEKNIKKAIHSAQQIADEVIVVDNKSTDNTANIAKKEGAKLYTRDNNQMLNINKNFGFSKATGDWIFLLDADEQIETDLAKEVKNSINSQEFDGYKIPRKNLIFGKWMEHTGWYPDFQTRLFRKGKGKFEEKHNHEQVTVSGEVGQLSSHLIHDHYQTIDQFLKKTFLVYTEDEKNALLQSGYKFNHKDVITRPFNEFIRRYFARQGYKDGFHGLILSLLMSLYHLIIMLKIWEDRDFPQLSEQKTDNMLKQEAKFIKKELKYWQTEKRIKQSKPLKKNLLRLTRRLS